MKKLIVLVGIMTGFSVQAAAVRTAMLDYLSTENYAMFEIKTDATNYQRVILDCQGFNMGVYLYNSNKVQDQFHMEEEDCQAFHQFLTEAKAQQIPVCLEIDAGKSLQVTDKSIVDCK